MTWRQYLLLALLGLAVATSVALLQPSPGYMDADYYYAGGLQLVNGHGFTEPYLWNYLDDPTGLPHPSFGYWMPLASLIAAAGSALFRSSSWFAARSGFLLVAALIPPLTASLAWSFTSRRDLAFTSGLLAVFPAFYLPFISVTDTFGPYMLLGGLFFLVLNRKDSTINFLLLGFLAGLMHLARADGLLWLFIAFCAIFFFREPKQTLLSILYSLLFVLAGYLLVMAPWFIRNYNVFGTPLSPGGSKMLWLTSYDQLFAYPADQITFSAWWQSGLQAILRIRLWALSLNLSNMLSVQGEVFLLPLIGIGFWHLRKDRRVQLAALAWFLTLVAMTLAFPFAGARGGFFHSGAAVQMVWWMLAPVGLEQIIMWSSRKRGWNALQAGTVFRPAMVGLALLLTLVVVYSRVIGGGGGTVWGQEDVAYRQVASKLVFKGMSGNSVVMVANPPGFYLASGNQAVAVPNGNLATLMDVAKRYRAEYLVLEAVSTPAGLKPVYDHPSDQAGLRFLGDVGGLHTYAIQP
jgi:hypothetical protein